MVRQSIEQNFAAIPNRFVNRPKSAHKKCDHLFKIIWIISAAIPLTFYHTHQSIQI